MHLNTICRWLLLPLLLCGALTYADEDEKDEDIYRFRFRGIPTPIERKGEPPRTDADDHGSHGLSESEMLDRQKKVTDFWNETRQKGGDITKADVVKLYAEAKDFSVVHALLGNVISADDSRAIGRLRAEIHEEVLQALAKSKKFGKSMGINDFGSGADLSTVDAKTDIDFTLYNKIGATGTAMVSAYVQEFRRITGQYGAAVDPGQCDIVAHRYEATLPDWRQATDLSMFEAKIRTGLDLLRSNPEAYFLEGAYMQQVMKRSVDPHAKTFTWYEVDESGSLSKHPQSAALQKEYFFHPETHARYAFGGAVGNWHFFHAHADDQVARAKYILRSMDDGVGMIHKDAKKGDFEKMSRSEQEQFVRKIYGGKFSPETVKGVMATLQTSINMRQLKKDKKLNLRSIEGQTDAYRPLIDDLRRTNPGASAEDLVKLAEDSFNKLGNAVLIENNIQSSTARLKDWLQPPLKSGQTLSAVDENGTPKKYTVDPATIKRLQYSAFFELLSAVDLMDEGLVKRIKEANPRYRSDIEILEGIIRKKKEIMATPEGMDPQEALGWRRQKAAELQTEMRRLKGVLQAKGYPAAVYEGLKSSWDAGQRFENWIQNAAVDSLLKTAGGKHYIPLLKKMRAEVQRTNQKGLGPKWMARIDKGNSLIEVLKVYAREGEINDRVLETAFYEALSYVPGISTLYSLQSGVQGVSTIVFVNVIPGYGQILLIGNLAKGTVELGGLLVFEPLKRDKVLLAYQGYLEKEEGGWLFFSGQKKRVESPRPPLLYPVDPGGNLPLDERREKMYSYLHDRVVARMKANPEIWYEEHEYPEDWQEQEFKELDKFAGEYVDHWWNATGPFSEFDVLTVHRGEDIRDELKFQLIQDYIKGKNIALQKMIMERQQAEEQLIEQYMDAAASEFALQNSAGQFRNDYRQMGEWVQAFTLDEMPVIDPSIEIYASQNLEEVEKDDDEEEVISEQVNLRAKVSASTQDHPGPWTIEWSMDNSKSGKIAFSRGEFEEVEARTGSVTVTAVAKDAKGREIAKAIFPLTVEKVKIREGEEEEKEEEDLSGPDLKEAEDILDKLKAAAARAGNLNQEARNKCDSSRKKAEEASKKIAKAENRIQGIAAEINTLQAEMDTLVADIFEAREKGLDLDRLARQIAEIRDRIRQKALKICQKARDIANAPSTKKQKAALNELLQLRREIEDEHEKGRDLIKQMREIQQALKQLQERADRFEGAVEKVEGELQKTEPEQKDAKSVAQDSRTDLDSSRRKTSQLRGVHGEAGELLDKGEEILKPIEGDSQEAKDLLDEMEGLFGNVQELKASVENCPEEASEPVREASAKQEALEDKLADTQDSLDLLLQSWGDSNAQTILRDAIDDAEATLNVIDIFWETVRDRIEDSELCEKLGKRAAETPPKLRVPDVRGKPAGDAMEILREAELDPAPVGGKEAPQEDLSFTVYSQSPSPGSSAKPGDKVTLEIYSAYIERSTVPNVIGLPAQAAVDQLTEAGFTPAPAGGDPAPEEDLSYKVYAQDPPPGEEKEAGTVVNVIIYGAYQPPPVYLVPDVTGMDKEAASKALGSEGFAAAGKEGDPALEKEQEGQVYAQAPPGGTEFDEEGASVSFTYYGKVKEEEPPEEALPGEEGQSYVVVCNFYFPEAVGKPPKDPDQAAAWYASLTLSQVKFVQQKEKIFLAFSKDALATYPPEFFTTGKKVSSTIRILVQTKEGPVELIGALLLEAEKVFTDLNALHKQFPKAKDPNMAIPFTSADGKFQFSINNEKGSGQFSGGPLVEGWPQEMKQMSLELYKTVMALFNCFIASTVYDFQYSPELDILRNFRDTVMMQSESGRRLVGRYYQYGPGWAWQLQQRPVWKALLRPIVGFTAATIKWADWENPAVRTAAFKTFTLADAVWAWLEKESSNNNVEDQK